MYKSIFTDVYIYIYVLSSDLNTSVYGLTTSVLLFRDNR